MLKGFFRKTVFSEAGMALYERAVAQGRSPVFYRELGVPDSIDGRFDLIALHIFLVMRRLRAEGSEAEALSQDLSEVFFADMDLNLRELGASDIGVGKRVKRMIEGFYGRALAYADALDGKQESLESVLRRNLYGTIEPDEATLEKMAAYVRLADRALAAQTWAELSKGAVRFPDPMPEGDKRVGSA